MTFAKPKNIFLKMKKFQHDYNYFLFVCLKWRNISPGEKISANENLLLVEYFILIAKKFLIMEKWTSCLPRSQAYALQISVDKKILTLIFSLFTEILPWKLSLEAEKFFLNMKEPA